MHFKSFTITCLILCSFLNQHTKAQSGVIAADAKLVLIDSNFKFTEGPAMDKNGNVFFTDQPNNKIWKYGIDGKLSVFLDKTGRANGLYFDKKGNIISCSDKKNQLWSIDKKGKIKLLVKDYNGHSLNGPNDLWIDPKGGIYITDPYYQRDYWTRKNADPLIGGQYVYFLPYGKKELMLVDSTTKKPNGIVGTPDGKYLYVADMGKGETYRYKINTGGTLSEKTLYINQASDGMTIDDRGNVYITGKGVTVYNPAGEKIDHIDVPENWTANICFGGKNRNILFITASKSFYMINTTVKGVQ